MTDWQEGYTDGFLRGLALGLVMWLAFALGGCASAPPEGLWPEWCLDEGGALRACEEVE